MNVNIYRKRLFEIVEDLKLKVDVLEELLSYSNNNNFDELTKQGYKTRLDLFSMLMTSKYHLEEFEDDFENFENKYPEHYEFVRDPRSDKIIRMYDKFAIDHLLAEFNYLINHDDCF